MGIFKKFKQNYMDNGFVIEMEKPQPKSWFFNVPYHLE